ncbi:MAG: hypothetical protein EXS50_02795 [Candidatus Taylorbacteria bacterium]|nr:hypothetical protein [Candidatus Taylorbacteria bacterium]
MTKDLEIKNMWTARGLRSGQVMITAVVFFLFITVTIVGGVAFSVLRQVKAGQDLIRSKESFFASESGVEDVLYRIKSGKNYSANESLPISDITASTTVGDITGGKSILSVSSNSGDVRKVYAEILDGSGAAFDYSLLAGSGGLDVEDTVIVNGSVYSNASSTTQVIFPISDQNVSSWKALASAGGTTTGNVVIGESGGSLGPRKIEGNLTVSDGGTLTLTGVVWVTGKITVKGGGSIVLNSSYAGDSGILISDEKITVSSGGSIEGSGQVGSYLLLLTTSSENSAISFSTTATTSAILNAQNGTIVISAGTVKQATGNRVTVSGNSSIDYGSNLFHVHFKTNTSQGVDIKAWKEIE